MIENLDFDKEKKKEAFRLIEEGFQQAQELVGMKFALTVLVLYTQNLTSKAKKMYKDGEIDLEGNPT